MACMNDCTSGGKANAEIVQSTISVPPSAIWGSPIQIGIDIVDKSVVIQDSICVDLHDLSGNCLDSTGEIVLGAGETKRIIFNAIMPSSGNFNGRISLSVYYLGILINTWGCADSLTISIRGVDPNIAHLVCDGKTKLCVNAPGAGSNLDGCNFVGDPCGGGTGTTPVGCTENDMNVMGICVPKPVVLGAFALVAIYIFKS